MIGDILQPTHLLFVLVIALLVLGPKRLPEAGKSLGRGLRDFKQALSGDEQDHGPNEVVAPAPVAATPVAPTPVAPTPVETSPQPAREPAEHAS